MIVDFFLFILFISVVFEMIFSHFIPLPWGGGDKVIRITILVWELLASYQSGNMFMKEAMCGGQ